MKFILMWPKSEEKSIKQGGMIYFKKIFAPSLIFPNIAPANYVYKV